MFGRVKQWFGIEGLKLKVDLADEYDLDEGQITGELLLTSMRPQRITFLQVRLKERYARGRGSSRKVDTYLLGKWNYDRTFDIDKENSGILKFDIPYEALKSNIDEMVDSRNPLRSGLARVAKRFKAVESAYFIEVEAVVEGTKVNPIKEFEVNIV